MGWSKRGALFFHNISMKWYERHDVSNCNWGILNSFVRITVTKTSKLCIIGPLWLDSTGYRSIPSQRDTNPDSASVSWCVFEIAQEQLSVYDKEILLYPCLYHSDNLIVGQVNSRTCIDLSPVIVIIQMLFQVSLREQELVMDKHFYLFPYDANTIKLCFVCCACCIVFRSFTIRVTYGFPIA